MYFIAGSLIKKYEVKLLRFIQDGKIFLISSMAFLVFAFCLRGFMSWDAFADRMFGSMNCMLYAGTLFIYVLGKKIDSHLIKIMSSIFLPCYVIHLIIIGHTIDLLNKVGVNSQWYASIIDLVVVYLLSCTISLVLMKIPIVNKIFRI